MLTKIITRTSLSSEEKTERKREREREKKKNKEENRGARVIERKTILEERNIHLPFSLDRVTSSLYL